MDTPTSHPSPAPRSGAHPLLIAAAIAVILFCTLGIAAILGWIPDSSGNAARLSAAGAGTDLALQSPSQLVEQSRTDKPKHTVVQRDEPVRKATVRRERDTRVAVAEPAARWCPNCGNVESVRKVTARARGTGVGAAGGAVLGGLLGHQVGGGSGKDIATVAGAVGGAVIGNQVEGNMRATTSYEVRVRLDDGTLRVFNVDDAPQWRTGDRVKIVNGGIHPA